MNPIDIAARALANMDESLYEIDEETTAMYNTDDNNAKRVKRDSMPRVPKPKPMQPPPSSLIVSFKNQEGNHYFCFYSILVGTMFQTSGSNSTLTRRIYDLSNFFCYQQQKNDEGVLSLKLVLVAAYTFPFQ